MHKISQRGVTFRRTPVRLFSKIAQKKRKRQITRLTISSVYPISKNNKSNKLDFKF